MYVRSVQMVALRTFVDAHLSLNMPRTLPARAFPNVTLLLGDNGAGKTTVLRAIALAALAPVIQSGSGYVPYSLVRRTESDCPQKTLIEAELVLHEQDMADGQKVTSSLTILPTEGFVDRFEPKEAPSWASPMWSDKSPAFLVLGYGAGRSVATTRVHESQRSKSRILRYERVAGLFEEGVPLMPLSSWLGETRRRSPQRFAEIVALMNQLLYGHGALLKEEWDEEPLFRLGGARLPFAALSDGYRAYIGWIGDLLFHINQGAPPEMKLIDQQGLVMVDEIDLHLHPAWQKEVIPKLARTLPNLQFVFTSHSPLVVGSVHGNNIRVLEPRSDSAAGHEILLADAEVYGLSADQVLTSGQFGLKTTRNKQFASKLRAATQNAMKGDADEAIEVLRMMTLGGAASATPGKQSTRRKKS